MRTHDMVDEQAVAPRWHKLFFGCFGNDAGSKKWANRGFWGALLMGVSMLAHFTLRDRLPEFALDAATAAGSAAGTAVIYWTLWRYIQDLDEMHQRMMFEALAFAFFATMTALVFAGVFGLSTDVTFNVLSLYVFGEAMRGLGLMLAGRRYR